MKRHIIVGTVMLSVIGAGFFGTTQASQVFAQSNGQVEGLVQMIADKFHLNKSDVQGVFDENRSTMVQKREQHLDDKLSQLVKDGKITDGQKTLILNKLKEIEANRSSEITAFKTMTLEQKKAKMQADKQSLVDWAKQNNIDPKYLSPRFGMGMPMHWRGHMMGK